MKRVIFLVALSSLALGSACKKADKAPENAELVKATPTPAASKPVAGHGGAPTQGAGAPTSATGATGSGTVSETMNSGGYTYVKLDGAQGEVWAAAPATTVKVGDQVSFASGMAMQGFRSESLDRTFDLVYFVPGLTINGAQAAAGNAEPTAAAKTGAVAADVSGIAKAKGGKTVAEVLSNKDALGGQEVLLRGKVVKYNGGIMGKNWLHLQDGTGGEGTNDLTVTTNDTAEVGATVLVKGKVALDKDFGAGYQYPVMIEDATLTVE